MEILKNNWKWKLTALILGFLLWSYIAAGVNPTQSMTINDIDVSIDNPEILKRQQLEIVSHNPDTVTAVVTGKRISLGFMEKSDVQASIDAGELHEGKQTAKIHYKLPSNIYINNDSTQKMEVLVEKIVHRNIPVQVTGQGTLPKNYVLESLTPTPKMVTVTGPRTVVDSIDHLEAGYDISSLTSDTSANVPIVPVDKSGAEIDGVNLSLSSVNIAASVYKIKSVPIKVAEQGKYLQGKKISSVNVTPSSLQIKGKTEAVNKVFEIETQPLEKEQMEKSGLVHTGLVFPEGISPVEELPEVTMEVTVLDETSGSIDIPFRQIKKKGLAQGVKLQPVDEDGKVSLSLRGFSDDFAKMEKTDFTVSASFKGVPIPDVGKEIELPITVKVPDIYRLNSYTPNKVKFKVIAK